MNKWIEDNWLKLLAIVLVLGGLPAVFPFVYYQLMNWIVMIAALATAWQAHKRNSTWVMALFALVAIVFNPLAPLYLSQDAWKLADIAAAGLFVLAIFLTRARK